MDFSKKYDNPSPEATANCISKLFYCWVFPLFKYGYYHDLEIKDLYNSVEPDLSEHLGDALQSNWEKELERAKEKSRKPEFLRAIKATFLKSYSFFGLELLFQVLAIKLCQPLVLAAFIHYFNHTEVTSILEGWILGGGVILMAFTFLLIFHHSNIGQARLGMRCRVAVCSLIYRKLLKLNQAQTSAGQIVNLLSNDVERFDSAAIYVNYLWIMPIATIAITAIMFNSVGPAAFVGVAAIALQAIPLQGYLSNLQGKLRYKIANATDRRVQLMTEIINGIQVIKMYAWEKPFEQLVAAARKLEIDYITTTSYIRGFLTGTMVFTERFSLFFTLVTYALLGNRLSGDKVFSMAQFFNSMQLYMAILFPLALSLYAEAKISVKRIEDFLLQEELLSIENYIEDVKSNETGTIKIDCGFASWAPNTVVQTLSDVNVTIKQGSLCAVVGPVGSGKTSLLHLILKELPLTSGKLKVRGNISYASQEPWLFASTVRNNILFGKPFVGGHYKTVVQVCALEKDFELLPYGDKTMVGERGVSLSGGQRARINLARAVYRQADVYLLDDPLSAVDPHVGKHLFEKCIVKHLRNKTRILVTHQLHFLQQADQIIIINNGQIEKIGTYAEIADKELSHLHLEPAPDDVEKGGEALQMRQTRLLSTVSITSANADEDEKELQETQELIEKGAISTSVYLDYLREGGGTFLLLLFFAMLVLAQVACNAGDLWSAHWTNEAEANYAVLQSRLGDFLANTTNSSDFPISGDSVETTTFTFIDNFLVLESHNNSSTASFKNDYLRNGDVYQEQEYSQSYYIYVYTALIVASIVLTTFRSFVFFRICMNSSRGLHNIMFHNVLEATMRFFDTNPSGRILNRFSKDVGAMDEILPKPLLESCQVFLVMAGILSMVFIVSPWMIAPTVVLAVLFFLVRKIYLASAQDIKRLEGITKAPTFSHVSASLSGLTTIRASHAEALITKEFDILQDQHTAAWFMLLATSEAFGFYLDLVSLTFLTLLTVQFLIFDDGSTRSADVGLVISHSLILMGMLQFGVRQTAEVASQMTSVERIIQYTKLEKEGPFETLPTKKPPRNWPQYGRVIFKNLSLRYTPEEPPVLNHLNINIQPGERVGIVGRTGAGKSSLVGALFRMAPTEGCIRIDEVDTNEIGLHDLRSKISIIPQEPVLFSASLRHNLDPLNNSDDQSLWKALEDVELKDAVEHLNQEVSEGGSNFSAGQRQLLCLARAILRNNKILVMDEATANVDPQTEALIQATIRRNFKECTVLTIAHRLNTVMDSDKVLVMDAGQAVEFGHPHQLLQNPDGYFASMVKETDEGMAAKLVKIAQECYNQTFYETNRIREELNDNANNKSIEAEESDDFSEKLNNSK